MKPIFLYFQIKLVAFFWQEKLPSFVRIKYKSTKYIICMHKSSWILITGWSKLKPNNNEWELLPFSSVKEPKSNQLKIKMTHKHVWESLERKCSELLSKNPACHQYMLHLRKIKLEKETERNWRNVSSAKKSEAMECCAARSWEENSSSKY